MEKYDDEVDISHPLVTFHFKECCKFPMCISDAQCVSVHGKIYVGGSDISYYNKLFVSTDLNSWSVLETPTSKYALTTYHSQLVLIGGEDSDGITNKVWGKGVANQWKSSLIPPMLTKRYASSAINTGNTQHIVVAGGMGVHGEVDTVEVLSEKGKWSIVQSLPQPSYYMKCAIHDGCLYFMGGNGQDDSVFYCKLDSLLSFLQSNDQIFDSETLWKTFNAPLKWSSCVTFHHHLMSVGGYAISSSTSSKIHAYSPLTQPWLHVGDLPIELDCTACTVISTGELVVIGGRAGFDLYSRKVFKATLIVSPFDLDGPFRMSALSKLEYAGVHILTSLKANYDQLMTHTGVRISYVYKDSPEDVEKVIHEWESGRTHFPPTWKSLLKELKELHLKELSQQIENFLYVPEPVSAYKNHVSDYKNHKSSDSSLEAAESADQTTKGTIKPEDTQIIGDLVVFKRHQLGRGHFGFVFEGTYKFCPCAVKILTSLATEFMTSLPTADQVQTDALKYFQRECKFLESFKHNNVVQHLATLIHPDSQQPILVTELMEQNLHDYYKKKDSCNDCLYFHGDLTPTMVHMSFDIACALEYLHSRDIVHRDFCGDNVLLSRTSVCAMPLAKVADFGMSRIINSETLSRSLTGMSHRMGYLPPEATLIDVTRYDKSLDIFCLGAIIIQIVNQLSTISSSEVRNKEKEKVPAEHVLKPVIQKCLHTNPKERPLASDLKLSLSAVVTSKT